MDPKHEFKLRQPSASASGLPRYSIGKTPLERMYQVTELSRRGRLMAKLAGHGRVNRRRAG